MSEVEIRKYAALMKELGLSGIEIDESRGYFRLECEGAKIATTASMDVGVQREPMMPKEKTYRTVSIKSPMVGVYYAAATEDTEPFVQVGDQVNKGDILCIVESMKLMNEVVAEQDGIIEAVCVTNGQLIEYGTELFRMKELEA